MDLIKMRKMHELSEKLQKWTFVFLSFSARILASKCRFFWIFFWIGF